MLYMFTFVKKFSPFITEIAFLRMMKIGLNFMSFSPIFSLVRERCNEGRN